MEGSILRDQNLRDMRFTAIVRAIWIALFAFVMFLAVAPQADAVTTVPTQMNFQGRLTNSAGNVVPDGTYNMRFRLYTVSTGGSSVWSEDRLVAATQGVSVTNGLFNVQLGSISAMTASLYASGALYMEVELPTPGTATTSSPSWTEGAMTPRRQMLTSAYAYNAETIDGLDSAALAQLSANNTFTGSNIIDTSSSTALQVKSGATNVLSVNSTTSQISVGQSDTTAALFVLDTKTSAGDPTGTAGAMYYNSNSGRYRCFSSTWKNCIPDLQDAYDNSTTAQSTITTTSGTKTLLFKAGTGFNSTSLFSIQDASSTNLFVVDSTNSRIYIGDPTVDATASLLVVDNSSSASDPTGTNGAIYYNTSSSRFRCYEAGAWRNCFTPLIRSYVDTTADTGSATNTTNYWDTATENNNSYPLIALSNTSNVVYGTVTIELLSNTSQDVEMTARVERNIGSAPTCNSGTQVGGYPGVFATNTGARKSSTITFVDNPATTSNVYYTVCADSASSSQVTNTQVTRIRVTLQEVTNSN